MNSSYNSYNFNPPPCLAQTFNKPLGSLEFLLQFLQMEALRLPRTSSYNSYKCKRCDPLELETVLTNVIIFIEKDLIHGFWSCKNPLTILTIISHGGLFNFLLQIIQLIRLLINLGPILLQFLQIFSRAYKRSCST